MASFGYSIPSFSFYQGNWCIGDNMPCRRGGGDCAVLLAARSCTLDHQRYPIIWNDPWHVKGHTIYSFWSQQWIDTKQWKWIMNLVQISKSPTGNYEVIAKVLRQTRECPSLSQSDWARLALIVILQWGDHYTSASVSLLWYTFLLENTGLKGSESPEHAERIPVPSNSNISRDSGPNRTKNGVVVRTMATLVLWNSDPTDSCS